MGMYDNVYIKCPNCGEEIYEQSKAYYCTLESYFIPSDNCPPAIVADMETEDIECEHCGAKVEVHVTYQVEVRVKE